MATVPGLVVVAAVLLALNVVVRKLLDPAAGTVGVTGH
jgi:hypothetical protein